MEQLFLLKIETTSGLVDLLRWYTQRSQTSRYVQRSIIEEHECRLAGRSSMKGNSLSNIVNGRPVEVPDLNGG
jgi:hypothetical protein